MKYDLSDFTLDSGALDHGAVVDALGRLSDRIESYEDNIKNLIFDMRRVIEKQRDMLDAYDRVYGSITSDRVVKEINGGDVNKDSIRGWIKSIGLVVDEDEVGISARELYGMYKNYVGDDTKCSSNTMFNKILCELGYDKIRRSGGMVFLVK